MLFIENFVVHRVCLKGTNFVRNLIFEQDSEQVSFSNLFIAGLL